MKKLVSIILFVFFQYLIFAQIPNSIFNNDLINSSKDFPLNITTQNTWDGAAINPVGQYRVLNILINIIYDQSEEPYKSDDQWPKAEIGDAGINTIIPTWAQDESVFDADYYESGNINGIFTRKYYESSFGQLHIAGDYVVITIPQSYITLLNPLPYGQFDIETLISRSIEYLNINGGLETVLGNESIGDYDLNNDGIIDFATIITRNTHKYEDSNHNVFNYGNYNVNNGTAWAIDDEILFHDNNSYPTAFVIIQCVGTNSNYLINPTTVIYHEFGHCLFGDNNMHSCGGNGWGGNSGRAFLPLMGGYGLMGMANTGMVSANGFDRWWLHWKSPVYNTSNSYIAANNQPSDVTQGDGTKNFILRDFVTTGDAIRIKLPFVDEGAKNQYIWLENHKIGFNNKLDFLTNSSDPCRPQGRPGI